MQINLGDISPEEMDGGLEWIVLKGDIQVTNIYVGKSLIVREMQTKPLWACPHIC